MSGKAAPPTVIVMACATAAETQALARRAEAVHARLRAAAQIPPGTGDVVTYRVNPRGGPNIVTRTSPAERREVRARANAAGQARAHWREAEKSFARLDAQIEQRKERDAVFRWLIDAGWLPL
ncbi:hypothetical protein OG741_19310 [Streptomyces sp. NBC_01410]|uniref:hypothetical protein n=1 Tax=Streptomyces sp. NBC_01410 TaxID=2903856 RepID=UPI00324494ED